MQMTKSGGPISGIEGSKSMTRKHPPEQPGNTKSRIPAFKSIEEEAEFWDTHSSEDFADELELATDVNFIKPRYITVLETEPYIKHALRFYSYAQALYQGDARIVDALQQEAEANRQQDACLLDLYEAQRVLTAAGLKYLEEHPSQDNQKDYAFLRGKIADERAISPASTRNASKSVIRSSDFKAGLALIFTFLAVGVFLYLSPGYFGNAIATRIVSAVLAIIGLLGLSFELNRLSGKKGISGVDDLGVGLGLILAWVVIYHFSPGWWWVNAVLLLLLLVPAFGTTQGTIKIIGSLLSRLPSSAGQSVGSSLSSLVVKLFLALAQVAAFVLVLLQLAQIFKVI